MLKGARDGSESSRGERHYNKDLGHVRRDRGDEDAIRKQGIRTNQGLMVNMKRDWTTGVSDLTRPALAPLFARPEDLPDRTTTRGSWPCARRSRRSDA